MEDDDVYWFSSQKKYEVSQMITARSLRGGSKEEPQTLDDGVYLTKQKHLAICQSMKWKHQGDQWILPMDSVSRDMNKYLYKCVRNKIISMRAIDLDDLPDDIKVSSSSEFGDPELAEIDRTKLKTIREDRSSILYELNSTQLLRMEQLRGEQKEAVKHFKELLQLQKQYSFIHPIKSFFVDEFSMYFVQEKMRTTMHKELMSAKTLKEKTKIAIECVEFLQKIGDSHLCHGNLNPKNIGVSLNNQTVLINNDKIEKQNSVCDKDVFWLLHHLCFYFVETTFWNRTEEEPWKQICDEKSRQPLKDILPPIMQRLEKGIDQKIMTQLPDKLFDRFGKGKSFVKARTILFAMYFDKYVSDKLISTEQYISLQKLAIRKDMTGFLNQLRILTQQDPVPKKQFINVDLSVSLKHIKINSKLCDLPLLKLVGRGAQGVIYQTEDKKRLIKIQAIQDKDQCLRDIQTLDFCQELDFIMKTYEIQFASRQMRSDQTESEQRESEQRESNQTASEQRETDQPTLFCFQLIEKCDASIVDLRQKPTFNEKWSPDFQIEGQLYLLGQLKKANLCFGDLQPQNTGLRGQQWVLIDTLGIKKGNCENSYLPDFWFVAQSILCIRMWESGKIDQIKDDDLRDFLEKNKYTRNEPLWEKYKNKVADIHAKLKKWQQHKIKSKLLEIQSMYLYFFKATDQLDLFEKLLEQTKQLYLEK